MNINEFVANLKLGGARPTHFRVFVTNPVNPIADLQIPFLCKAAQIPAENRGQIPVNYFGRATKLEGNRVYDDWTVTVINDEDFLIRNALEQWSNAMNGPESNRRNLGSASPLQYRTDAYVEQYSKTGVPIRKYKFHNLWPSSIGPIDLSWDQLDAIEEYTVTFTYDYHTVSGLTGDAGSGDGLL